MSIDKRYESDIDGIARIPAKHYLAIDLETSYNVVGNFPLVVRESLLGEVYEMGERFVERQQIDVYHLGYQVLSVSKGYMIKKVSLRHLNSLQG